MEKDWEEKEVQCKTLRSVWKRNTHPRNRKRKNDSRLGHEGGKRKILSFEGAGNNSRLYPALHRARGGDYREGKKDSAFPRKKKRGKRTAKQEALILKKKKGSLRFVSISSGEGAYGNREVREDV